MLANELPAVFFGAFFFGETVILSAAFLAGQGIWSVANVFWLAFVGTILSDMLWFLLGKSIASTDRWGRMQKKYERFLVRLDAVTGHRPFLSLLFIKFIYGTRILIIVYLSVRKLKLWRFVVFDAIGTVLWLAVMLSVGWLAGKGIANIVGVVHTTQYALLGLVLVIILFKFATVWIEKKLTKK